MISDVFFLTKKPHCPTLHKQNLTWQKKKDLIQTAVQRVSYNITQKLCMACSPLRSQTLL